MKKQTSFSILLLVFFLGACDTYSRHVAGVTPEERDKEKVTKDQLWEENKKLREKSQEILATDKEVLAKSREVLEEYRAMKAQQNLLEEKIQSLETQLQETAAVAEKQQQGEARPPKRSRVNIKVLASHGGLETARATARKLKVWGYPTARIDRVKKKFDGTRVYYADGFEAQAKEIASGLGGGTVIVLPLTWRSIFDIIVVTDTMR